MRIGFIGLGNMGGPMCRNLLRAGLDVCVYDTRREVAQSHIDQGASWADSIAALADECQIIFTSLPGPQQFEAVVLGPGGICTNARRGAICVDFTTNSVSLVRRIHALLKDRQIDLLDAPVSGGVPGAEAGTLAMWASGDEVAYAKVEPLLKFLADRPMHVGAIGSGTIAKLVHNQIALTNVMVLAEGMTLGVKAGAKPDELLKALSAGMLGRSSPLNILGKVFSGDFDTAMFALALARKDLALAAELGREHNVPMPLAALYREALEGAMARGWGGRDSSAMFAYQEELAGVTVRSETKA